MPEAAAALRPLHHHTTTTAPHLPRQWHTINDSHDHVRPDLRATTRSLSLSFSLFLSSVSLSFSLFLSAVSLSFSLSVSVALEIPVSEHSLQSQASSSAQTPTPTHTQRLCVCLPTPLCALSVRSSFVAVWLLPDIHTFQ